MSLALGLSVSIGVLVIVPSSALAHLPGGSFYPVIVAIASLGVALLHSRNRLARPPHLWSLIAFYAITAVASVLFGVLAPFAFLLSFAVILAYLCAFSVTDAERRVTVIVIISLALLETALAAGEVFLAMPPLLGEEFTLTPDNPFLNGFGRGQGTLAHPLALSFLLLAGVGLSRTLPNRLGLAVSSLLLLGVVLTGSTSAFIAAAVIIGLRVFTSRNTMLVFVVAICVGFAAVLFTVSGVFGRLLEEELDPRNAGHRINSVLAIPNLIFGRDFGEVFLGSGYGSVEGLYTSGIFFNDGFYAVDNQFVTFLVQGGLLGLIFAVIALAGLTLRQRREYIPIWFGLLFMGLSFDFMSWFAPALIFVLIAAFGTADRHVHHVSNNRGRRQRVPLG